MNNQVLQLKVRQSLNKLASNDYDNIVCWQIVEKFNKVQPLWTRKNLHGLNVKQEGDEQSTSRIDDFQILLTTSPVLNVADRGDFYETVNILPQDYLRFKRVSCKAKTDCCPERKMVVYLGEAGNLDLLLRDKNKQPSFEWGETFATFSSDKLRIYTNAQFEVIDPTLTYYRQPRRIEIAGCKDPYTGITPTTDVECEFKDDIVELLIEATAGELAKDIESIIQAQRAEQNVEKNN